MQPTHEVRTAKGKAGHLAFKLCPGVFKYSTFELNACTVHAYTFTSKHYIIILQHNTLLN